MSDKRQEIIPGVDAKDLPELVAGAKFAASSELDAFLASLFPVDKPSAPKHID